MKMRERWVWRVKREERREEVERRSAWEGWAVER